MDNEKMIKMDPNILFSYINTKLRDEFRSLEILCEEYDLQEDVLINKLGEIGYEYNGERNQFIAN